MFRPRFRLQKIRRRTRANAHSRRRIFFAQGNPSERTGARNAAYRRNKIPTRLRLRVFAEGGAAHYGSGSSDVLADFFGDVGVLHEVSLCGLAPLPYELAVIGNPRALLFEYLLLYTQID